MSFVPPKQRSSEGEWRWTQSGANPSLAKFPDNARFTGKFFDLTGNARQYAPNFHVLSAGYYDAYYLKAQKVRQLISQDFMNAFRNVDVIAGPTAPTTAFAIGE